MKIQEYVIHWHNFICGTDTLEDQLGQAKWCVKALEGIIKLEKAGAIKLNQNCCNHPSIINWDVIDEKAYEKAQKEYDLPDVMVWDDDE